MLNKQKKYDPKIIMMVLFDLALKYNEPSIVCPERKLISDFNRQAKNVAQC